MTRRYFLFDVETGGLDENKTSLLTLYGMILDENLEKIDAIDLKVKPDDGMYHLDIEAMKSNKINILEHDKVAIFEREAAMKLRDFLFRHCPTNDKLIPAGHNINLDVRFATKLVPDWKSFCGRRWLDTASQGQFSQLCGKIPEKNNGSLAQLCLHYGIDIKNHHDAHADTEMTHALLKAMVRDLGVGLLPKL